MDDPNRASTRSKSPIFGEMEILAIAAEINRSPDAVMIFTSDSNPHVKQKALDILAEAEKRTGRHTNAVTAFHQESGLVLLVFRNPAAATRAEVLEELRHLAYARSGQWNIDVPGIFTAFQVRELDAAAYFRNLLAEGKVSEAEFAETLANLAYHWSSPWESGDGCASIENPRGAYEMTTSLTCSEVRHERLNGKEYVVVIASTDERRVERSAPVNASSLARVKTALSARGVVLGQTLPQNDQQTDTESLDSPVYFTAADDCGVIRRLIADRAEKYSLSSGSTLCRIYVPSGGDNMDWLIGRPIELAAEHPVTSIR